MPISYKHKIYTTNGWLTSYKRKLYMGRNIEWNQLMDKSKFDFTGTYAKNGVDFINNGDGTYTVSGTASQMTTAFIQKFIAPMSAGHVYYMCGIPESAGSTNDMRFGAYSDSAGVFFGYNTIITASSTFNNVRMLVNTGCTVNNVLVKPQLFDLTQMFGAGNEPTTPEEFWSYFDHKLYPYNAGETQPLFKISRKSQWGSVKPQLSTPQNVSADGTTVSWDEVENATSYEIFADGTSIGTVEVGTASNFTSSDGSVLLTSDGQIFNVKEN